jgi:hypothetical protein
MRSVQKNVQFVVAAIVVERRSQRQAARDTHDLVGRRGPDRERRREFGVTSRSSDIEDTRASSESAPSGSTCEFSLAPSLTITTVYARIAKSGGSAGLSAGPGAASPAVTLASLSDRGSHEVPSGRMPDRRDRILQGALEVPKRPKPFRDRLGPVLHGKVVTAARENKRALVGRLRELLDNHKHLPVPQK